ncbi:MAG: CoB--CoM heterodisulfide reductase iron-sulfur subunit B family protein [Anaerolineales bacterium]|nr:CoB--CoM heterodisulfide reductase iron-sulfur subunit B family protein [Anaerolineales bacterium]
MKYGYYAGCSLEGISVEYDHSIRSLFEQLDVTIEDLPEWICCGTLAAPSISRLLGVATPLWNIVKAKQAGYEQMIAPCSACVYHFKYAAKQVSENPALKTDVEAVLETSLSELPAAVHPLEILTNDGFEARIKGLIQREMADLKVVCYYGCHISRPAEVMQFDDPDNPESMDRVLNWVGVQTLDWSGKVDCCGAHFSLIKPEVVVDLSARLIEAALKAGADAIVVACPMCHANLDTRQDQIAEKIEHPTEMPILYFSQVLGYALGLEPKDLGLKRHIVDPIPLMLEKCQRNQAMIEVPGSSQVAAA